MIININFNKVQGRTNYEESVQLNFIFLEKINKKRKLEEQLIE